uniref:Golgi apparatus membrane protein TVP23 homolog n=1 Tax=Lotharella globosa TaxID=91324 RepID=A0A7S3YZH2_9EUKA|mmetsp:Transcript_3522/g.7022  ORF Transcript_3522/g.7022 Transcript_3522/m.7022 type:complete len:183 (+) Transcript_3522:31-579(+)|eukprot:CAMPEP_0167792450 /NCGR_PEP_ID=MMETSP0111_2-20121227/12569_1 /TAXON_ID=91324 /ORGANISM="Lotharella globosa, Strain CCCM811" /LENGTH=182 /DNA_ID=CAMNT_0007685373 /DNA_START=29 /DNA_END=577 /DNA_ORIENTATION=-
MQVDEAENLDLVDEEVPEEKTHKVTTLFHVLFKGAAIFMYIFGWAFAKNFVINFVVIVLLLAFDFWTVKNVTGRLLVGLRWWNEVNEEDGSNKWIFESRPDGKLVNAGEARTFWTTLILTPLIWIVFALSAIISWKFQWFILCCVAITLSGTNLWGYYKCRYDSNTAKQALANYAVGFMSAV